MTGPRQGSRRIGHFPLRIDEGERNLVGSPLHQFLGGNQVGKRLQSPLPGDGGLGAPLRLVREIEVFQFGFLPGGFDPGRKFRSEFPLFLDGLEHRYFPLFKLREVGEALLDGPDFHFVQLSGPLLPVAGDERDRRPFPQQGQRCSPPGMISARSPR